MWRDSFHAGRSAWRRLLASTLVVVPIWWSLGGSTTDRTEATDHEVSKPAVSAASVFVPGQGASAAPDHAMLSAADVERALPPSSRAATVGFEATRS